VFLKEPPPPSPAPTLGQALLYAQEPDQIFILKNIKTYHKFSSVFGGILTEHNILSAKLLWGHFALQNACLFIFIFPCDNFQ
jgi:hypothetical protein